MNISLKLIATIFFCLLLGTSNLKGSEAEVLNYKTVYSVKGSKLYVTKTIDIVIKKRTDEAYTKFRIPYSKNYQVKTLEGSITDVYGRQVKKLKKSEITDQSYIANFALYEDDFIKTFSLKHNKYPYIVHCKYTLEYDEYTSLPDWSPVYKYGLPTKSASLKLEVPLDYEINILENRITSIQVDTIEENIVYKWEADYITQLSDETFSPPRKSQLPSVRIAPVYFNYGIKGSLATWEEYGNWQYRLMQGRNELPANHKNEIKKLISNTSDKKEITRILYNYLQDNFRYIYVGIDIGGLQPYPASHVAEHKYGDCKGLSNYMKSILAESDINSFYVNIYADEKIYIADPSFASPDFNHIILMVPFEHDTTWLECTSQIAPFGYLGTSTQGRYALMVDEKNSKLIKTPTLESDDVRCEYNYSIDLLPNTNADVQFTAKYRGDNFEYLAYINDKTSHTDKEEYIEKLIPFTNYQLNNWSVRPRNRNEKSIDIDFDLKIPDLVKQLGNEYYLNLPPIALPKLEKPAKRNMPVQVSYPIVVTDTCLFDYSSMQIANIPEDQAFESKYGNYSTSFEREDNKILAIRSYSIYMGNYPLDEYTDFFNFYQEINQAERSNVLVFKIQ